MCATKSKNENYNGFNENKVVFYVHRYVFDGKFRKWILFFEKV